MGKRSGNGPLPRSCVWIVFAPECYHLGRECAQGSVVATTSSAQAQTGEMRYDAFGNKTYYVNTAGTFGWNAKSQYQTDAFSGLMLLGNRYYDSTVGRFISQDPAQDESNIAGRTTGRPASLIDRLPLRTWNSERGERLHPYLTALGPPETWKASRPWMRR